MTRRSLVLSAAIEPPAGLSEVGPMDSIAVLRGPQGLACLVTDASPSWGVGVEGARRTVERLRNDPGGDVTDIRALAKATENAAFEAEAALARQHPEADALFAGAIVTVGAHGVSWAWAGDLMVALCSLQDIACLNGEVRTAKGGGSKLSTSSTRWFPGLLGCSRAQRQDELFTFGGADGFRVDQAILILSRSVWSTLDEHAIVNEARRTAERERVWQSQLPEGLLRIAKSRGAAGHRAVVGIYSGFDSAPMDSLARSGGYRARSITDASGTRLRVEERESEREVLLVEVLSIVDGVLTVTFKNPSRDLNRATARRLVYELVLEGVMAGRFRNATKVIRYVDLDGDATTETAYGRPA